jgi:hypothetical protein
VTGWEYLPAKFYWYADGLHVQAAAPEHRDIVGARVIAIGNSSADTALARAARATAADNEFGLRASAPQRLSRPAFLVAAGISSSAESVAVTVQASGSARTVWLRSMGRSAAGTPVLDGYWEAMGARPGSDWIDAAPTGDAEALWLRERTSLFFARGLPQSQAYYVRINGIANSPGEALGAFVERVLHDAAAAGAHRLILDLRMNGGGNNGLLPPVVRALVKSGFDQPDRLFFLVGRHTFSAAQNLVNQLERYTRGTFVGEPTGARPNHYGEARRLVLPNSGLTVFVSSLFWQDLDPRDRRPFTAPRLFVPLTAVDYGSGRDPVLRAALTQSPRDVAAAAESLAVAGDTARLEELLRAAQPVLAIHPSNQPARVHTAAPRCRGRRPRLSGERRRAS